MRSVMEKSLRVTDYCVVKSDTWFLQDSACWVLSFSITIFFPLTSDK